MSSELILHEYQAKWNNQGCQFNFPDLGKNPVIVISADDKVAIFHAWEMGTTEFCSCKTMKQECQTALVLLLEFGMQIHYLVDNNSDSNFPPKISTPMIS